MDVEGESLPTMEGRTPLSHCFSTDLFGDRSDMLQMLSSHSHTEEEQALFARPHSRAESCSFFLIGNVVVSLFHSQGNTSSTVS